MALQFNSFVFWHPRNPTRHFETPNSGQLQGVVGFL